MASLLTNANLTLSWTWDDQPELSNVANTAKISSSAAISDAAVANIVWQDSRTLAANTIESIDLSTLPVEALGAAGTVSFDRIHKVYIANKTTAATLAAVSATEATLRVGLPDNQTAGHYALGVGYSSFSFLYSLEGWLVEGPLLVANPTPDVTISFDLVIIGQGEISGA